MEPLLSYDEAALALDEIEVVFQVNGKVRGRQKVAAGIDSDRLSALTLAHEGVQRILDGREPRRVVVVKGKLVNVVV